MNSLSHLIISQYNISPETLLEQKHPSVTVDKILDEEINFELYKDSAVCANGAMYRKRCSWILTRDYGKDIQRSNSI